jgi:hypothetical protein
MPLNEDFYYHIVLMREALSYSVARDGNPHGFAPGKPGIL